MHLAIINEVVSLLAAITTVLQFLSGILVCKTYVTNHTTGDSSPLPFLGGVVSCSLWLLYGLTKMDNLIVFVNAIGITMMLSYSFVFYKYSLKKNSFLRQVAVAIGFLILIMTYVNYEEEEELLLKRLGGVACLLTLFTIAAPLSKLFLVIRVKSTECLPFPMILMSLFVSMLWLLYGVLHGDSYISFSNFIGTAITVFQLSLFMIYPRRANIPQLTSKIVV